MDSDSHWTLSHSSDKKNCLNCPLSPIIIIDGKFNFKSISDSAEQDSNESIYEIIRPAESESDFEVGFPAPEFACVLVSIVTTQSVARALARAILSAEPGADINYYF